MPTVPVLPASADATADFAVPSLLQIPTPPVYPQSVLRLPPASQISSPEPTPSTAAVLCEYLIFKLHPRR
ncbi:hypothetical protein NM688_g2637 [Phlebia brevispora]|uniref:Uncharacterized protein n=1 Tax=Phlebia brevispora TaxID=194682 RepID=A0ACC1T7S6_9APHY|nr:hypothetical protein NM688_g2637 [Phlebia brevispora]